MAIPTLPKHLFKRPFASQGNYTVIPDESGSAGHGRASLMQGFPIETQQPLAEGGVAPSRPDFNGILYMLSSFAYWQQSGGLWTYDASLGYTPPAVVYHKETLWWCLAANGEGSAAGRVEPGMNDKVWIEFKKLFGGTDGNPVGTVIMYHGVNAPEGYFACNGQSFSATEYPILRNVLGSTIVPDLRGYFIRGYDTRNAVDPDGPNRHIGEKQNDAIKNITGHIFSDCFTRSPGSATGPFRWYQNVGGASGSAKSGGSNGGFTFDASLSVDTSSEVRPKNKTLLYCIKHD